MNYDFHRNIIRLVVFIQDSGYAKEFQKFHIGGFRKTIFNFYNSVIFGLKKT